MTTNEIEQVKLRTLKATMHTVEDTLGNALISMQLVLRNSDHDQPLNARAQSRLLGIIDEALDQLDAMRRVNIVNEKPLIEDVYYLDIN